MSMSNKNTEISHWLQAQFQDTQSKLLCGKNIRPFFHFLLLFKIVLDIENEQYYYYQYYWQYSNHQFTDSEQIVT